MGEGRQEQGQAALCTGCTVSRDTPDPSAATTLNACTFVPERIEYDFYIPSYMDVYLEAIASVIPSMPEVTVDSHIQLHQGM